MIVLSLVLAGITIFLLLLISNNWKKSCDTYPPGPRGIPLVGNLVQLAMRGPFHLKLAHWALQYGKMYTLHLAQKTFVVVNDVNLMKEVLGKLAATGRDNLEILSMLTWSGKYGILMAEGTKWLEQKQFLIKTVTQFAFGREGRMEPLVLVEADKLCDWIETKIEGSENKLFLNQSVIQCTGNVIWAMLTGQSREQMLPPRIVQLLQKWMLHIPNLHNQAKMSLFKTVAPGLSGYKEAKKLRKEIQEIMEHHFNEHRDSRIMGEPPRDIIDAYIEKVENCRDESSEFYGESGWKNIYSSTLFIIAGGADTTGLTISWILYYLSVDNQVQKRLKQEIDCVIGKNRGPVLGDRNKMPYLEAVILEALRFSSTVPSGGSVKLLDDVTVDGYIIPKGTQILANLYFVHYDKAIWGDPENFRPARFLEDGNANLKDYVVAFQPGKRTCPGAHLAKDIIFLFVAKLFQNFTFSADPSVKNVKEYLDPEPGVLRKPKDLALVVTRRD